MSTTSVLGRNCAVDIRITTNASVKSVRATIPIKDFQSGNQKRDQHVREILGNRLVFESQVPVNFMSQLKAGSVRVFGHLYIKDRGYRINLIVELKSGHIVGNYRGKLSDFNIDPPVVGPGGIIAKAQDDLILEFRIALKYLIAE